MRTTSFLPWVVLSLLTLCRADAFTDAVVQLPTCGTKCIIDKVPESACKTLSNTTCLCTDVPLYNAVLVCVAVNCTAVDALTTARVQALACQIPVRSRKPDLFAAMAIEIPAFLCALLRLFSRWWTTARFEVDDCIMIATTLFYAIFEVIGQLTGALAFGQDIWTVDEETLTLAFKLFYIDESFYLVVLHLTKVSILFFYLRVFPHAAMRKAVYAVMAWVVLSGLVFLFMQIFQCWPIDYNWNGWKGNYGPHKCVDIKALTFTAAGFGIAQDLVILILPLPIVARLNASWRSRIAIMFMFSLGIFILVTSCIRLRSLVAFGDSMNPTWDYADVLIWTGLELAVGIIVACLPAIRLFLSRVMPKIFGTTVASTEESHGFECQTIGGSGGQTGAFRNSAKRHTKRFSTMATELEHGNESQLELGDKIHGQVLTEIGSSSGGSGRKASHSDARSVAAEGRSSTISSVDEHSVDSSATSPQPLGTTLGIHVHTIMSRRSTAVDDDEKGLDRKWQPLGS